MLPPAPQKTRTGATLAIVSLALFRLGSTTSSSPSPCPRTVLTSAPRCSRWSGRSTPTRSRSRSCSSRAPPSAIASVAAGCSSSAFHSSPPRAPPRRWRRHRRAPSPPERCRASAARSSPRSPSPCSPTPSRPIAAAPRWASGRGSAAPASRWGRSSAARSSTASPGTGSSGSTSRIGLALLPVAALRPARELRPRRARLDLPGLGAGRGRPLRRSSSASSAVRPRAGPARSIVASLAGRRRRSSRAFVAWELRAKAPMVPIAPVPQPHLRGHQRACRSSCTSGRSASIFLLTQFAAVRPWATRPFQAGVRMLLWTGGDDDRRADRRRAVRAHRRARLHGRGAGAAGGARWRGSPRRPAPR